MSTLDVLAEVRAERERQDARWGVQQHPNGTGGPHRVVAANEARQRYERAAAEGGLTYLHIMEEEVREAFAETDVPTLRQELIQVAAVAVAWVEKLDRERAASVVGVPVRTPDVAGVLVRAAGCRHCAGVISITNDLGDVRCSGCGRDWAVAS